MDVRMLLADLLAERVVLAIARHGGRLLRFEAHVVPAEILEPAADLAEALRPHGGPGGALAGEKTGREGRERLGFAH